MNSSGSLQDIYKKYCSAVAYIAVINEDGTEGIGSAFHIGDGVFVTAKHVLDGKQIKEIATTKRVEIDIEGEHPRGGIKYIYPGQLELIDGPHYPEDDIADIAVFRVRSTDLLLPQIPLGSHTDISIDDNSFILQNTIVIGYPPIPFTKTPNQVVASGQVNAVIDVWHSKYAHFVISALARGGFSGGVALTEDGKALGVITESLVSNDMRPELGYMSVIGIEAVVELARKRYSASAADDASFAMMETLVNIKFVEPDMKRYNSRVHSASIYIYDDDRDLFGELFCPNPEAAKIALDAFSLITPIYTHFDVENEGYTDPDKTGSILFYMKNNPPAKVLIEASFKTRDALIEFGYEIASSFVNTWQTGGPYYENMSDPVNSTASALKSLEDSDLASFEKSETPL